MLAGIIGAPNKGKSTLFSALTSTDVQIADYPFTTIKPNVGIAYITEKCPHVSLGLRACNPKNSGCINGIRQIPVKVIDVAGLIEGAHEGKGMGNQFLNDIAAADALIIVVDVSGRTDPMGNPCQNCDPSADIKMVLEELAAWLSDIIKRHIKDGSGEGLQGSLAKALAGLKVSDESIEKAVKNSGVSAVKSSFTDADLFSLAKAILSESKPFIIAANKADIGGHSDNLERLKKEYGGANVVACSAAVSLAVNKAVAQGIIEKGADGKIALLKKGIPEEQERAVSFIKDFIERNGDGVQTLINKVYLEVLNNIVVYPVEDEHRFTDHFGNVLPDAILLKKGGTALDLAREIHTEIAEKMLYAIDARTKMRIAKDHVLNDGDIIKIVSAAGKA